MYYSKPRFGIAGQCMPGLQIIPFDAMASAAGISRTVKVAELKRFGVKITGETVINPGRVSCWLPDREDIWRKEGIWEIKDDNPVLLRPHHFSSKNEPVKFFRDYLRPFINRYASEIREIHPDTLIFIAANRLYPAIYGYIVVWVDKRFGRWDLFWHDLVDN